MLSTSSHMAVGGSREAVYAVFWFPLNHHFPKLVPGKGGGGLPASESLPGPHPQGTSVAFERSRRQS